MSTYFKLGARIDGLATTPTAGSTTALSAASRPVQQFTGTLTQTITLPDATTLKIPRRFDILNRSTQPITVNNFGGALVATIPADSQRYFLVTDISTANGSWQTAGVSSGGGNSGVSASDRLNLLGGLAGLYADSDTFVSRKVKFNPEEVGGQTLIVKTSLPTPQAWPVGGVLNGYGYSIAGTTTGAVNTDVLYRYNDDNDFFLSRAVLSSVKTNGTSFTLNGKLYAIGGHSSTGDSQVYNDVTNTWAAITATSTNQRVGSVGFTLEFGYIAGGTDGVTPSAELLLYSDVTNQWYSRQNMSAPKVGGSLFMFDNIPHVHSGSTDSGATSPSATMFIYNVSTNAWRSGISRNTALAQSGGSVSGPSGFVGGGYNGSISVATAEEYSNVLQKWSARLDISLARHGILGFNLNGSAYIGGGRTIPANGYSAIFEKYTNAAFVNLGVVKASNSVPTSILVAALTKDFSPNLLVQIRTDGSNWKNLTSGIDSALKIGESIVTKFVENHSLMVAGGGSPQVATSELHNPVTITWTARASMITPRGGGFQFPIDGYGHAGAGGAPPNTAHERYHDITNSWASRTAITQGRDRTMSHNLNGFGYVYSTSGTSTNNQQKYNSALDSWTIPSSTYAVANGYALGYSLAGHGYIIGGESGGSVFTNNYQYSDVLDAFTSKAAVHTVSQGGSVPFEGLGYVHGGYNGGDIATVSSYNPSTNAWTARTSLATAQRAQRGDYVFGYIYQISGTASPTSVFRFNPYQNTWSSSLTALSTAREYPQIVMPGFFRGYEVRLGIPVNYAGLGDGVWTSAANVTTNHNVGAGLNIGGFGYMLGGFVGGGSQTAQTDRYDETLDIWAVSTPNSSALYSVAAFELEGRGHRAAGQAGTNTHEALDPVLKVWTTLTNIIGGVADYAQGSTLNGRGYVLGASGASTAQYYKNATNAWVATTSPGAGLQSARWAQNGFIYLAGADGTSIATQKFNDVTEVWSSSASMNVARRGHAVLHNGFGLMAGSGTSYVSSSELYNDIGNFWRLSATMVLGSGYHTPFALQNASYFAGGWNGGSVLNTQRFSSGIKNAVLGLALEIK